MRYDDLPAALRAWLEETLALGTDRAGVLDALRAAGYESEYARAAVDAAFARPRPPASAVAGVALAPTREGLAAAAVASAPAVPAAVFPNRIEVSDRCVDVLFAMEAPRIIARQAGTIERGQQRDRRLRRSSPPHEPGHALPARRD
jgi:hypothetical protein